MNKLVYVCMVFSSKYRNHAGFDFFLYIFIYKIYPVRRIKLCVIGVLKLVSTNTVCISFSRLSMFLVILPYLRKYEHTRNSKHIFIQFLFLFLFLFLWAEVGGAQPASLPLVFFFMKIIFFFLAQYL
jgi:hypothetical protein